MSTTYEVMCGVSTYPEWVVEVRVNGTHTNTIRFRTKAEAEAWKAEAEKAQEE